MIKCIYCFSYERNVFNRNYSEDIYICTTITTTLPAPRAIPLRTRRDSGIFHSGARRKAITLLSLPSRLKCLNRPSRRKINSTPKIIRTGHRILMGIPPITIGPINPGSNTPHSPTGLTVSHNLIPLPHTHSRETGWPRPR